MAGSVNPITDLGKVWIALTQITRNGRFATVSDVHQAQVGEAPVSELEVASILHRAWEDNTIQAHMDLDTGEVRYRVYQPGIPDPVIDELVDLLNRGLEED